MGEATALILVYTTFMNIERWTLGYSLLMPPEEDPNKLEKKAKKEKEANEGEGMLLYGPNLEMAHINSPEVRAARSHSLTGGKGVKEELEKPIPKEVTDIVPEKKKPKPMTFAKRMQKSFNPPALMSIFAIIIGLITPIRDEIFASDAPAQPAFTSAIRMIGNAYLCGIFLTLGGNLYTQLRGSLEDGPTWRQIVGVAVARFLLVPGITCVLVMSIYHYTDWMKGNKLMAYCLMLQASGPTAVSLSTICQTSRTTRRGSRSCCCGSTAWCSSLSRCGTVYTSACCIPTRTSRGRPLLRQPSRGLPP